MAWEKLAERRTERSEVEAISIFDEKPKMPGLSKPFLVLCDDGNKYWIKMGDNDQSKRVPATEQIVARCGALIGAPICPVALVMIPEILANYTLPTGVVVKPGIAHGSLNIEFNLPSKSGYLKHLAKDDNRRRHAGYFALYDWCWGADPQWLYDVRDQHRIYTFDHGHFLGGCKFPRLEWTPTALEAYTNSDTSFWNDAKGTDAKELFRIADCIESVSADELIDVLAMIPLEWPVETSELEAVGEFLLKRGPTVAARLRKLA